MWRCRQENPGKKILRGEPLAVKCRRVDYNIIDVVCMKWIYRAATDVCTYSGDIFGISLAATVEMRGCVHTVTVIVESRI